MSLEILETSFLKRKLCAAYFLASTHRVLGDKTLYLDRDGVIINDYGYVNTRSKTKFNDQILNIMQECKNRSINLCVISNQSGVARNLFTEAELIEYNEWLFNKLNNDYGIAIDSFWYCPSHPEGVTSYFRRTCRCRKPEIEMFLAAEETHNYDRYSSVFIGDSESDSIAALSLGIPFFKYSLSGFERVSELLLHKWITEPHVTP